MSRLGVSSNLFGSLYDPERDRTQSVFNQNPTGRAGQAASFAAAQQSAMAKQEQQRQDAIAAAQQQQAAVQAEATAAQQRREQAQAEAFREQEFKLQQAQFENNKAIEAQKLEESKRAAFAQEAARQNQERAARGTSQQQQYQRALGGDNMAKSMQNHNARLKGQPSPFPYEMTPASLAMEQTRFARGNSSYSGQALTALNKTRANYGLQPTTKGRLSRFGNGRGFSIVSSLDSNEYARRRQNVAAYNQRNTNLRGSGAANAFQR